MTDPTPEPEPLPVSDEPCIAVHPAHPAVTCELFLNHFDFRLPHTSHANGTIYEWE